MAFDEAKSKAGTKANGNKPFYHRFFSKDPMIKSLIDQVMDCKFKENNNMPTMQKLKPLSGLAIGLAAFLIHSPAGALSPVNKTEKENLVAHRAVYDLKLDDSVNGANITDANGRMVFEVSGSKCEGYLVSMRFILSITDSKGSTNITDVRSSSWEDGEAKRFRFNTSQYNNQKLSKTTIGDAERKGKNAGIRVNIKSPKQGNAKFEEKIYFPTEHTNLVIAKAEAGAHVVTAPLYDGSENGNTLYETTTIIGKPILKDADLANSKIKNIDQLKGVKAWPIAISFFDRKNSFKQDLLPDYEISFRLYKNGVSTNLLIDYGDFSLSGDMKEIEFLPQTPCP